jgi:hypothetical protein
MKPDTNTKYKTMTTTTEQILALFNIECTSVIEVRGSIFEGCGDTYEGTFEGYIYHSKWVGINGRFSTITSPNGERVAHCRDGGFWFCHENCPEWLMPLGDDYRRQDAERAAERAEELAAEEEVRRDRDELDRILDSYRGTRLFKHLARLGKSHLAYLA